mgnify:CR=1 FL=1
MTATPGPWGLRGSQIRAEAGTGAHVATYQIDRDDGFLIAAAPTLETALKRLLAAVIIQRDATRSHSQRGNALSDAVLEATQALNDADPLDHRKNGR